MTQSANIPRFYKEILDTWFKCHNPPNDKQGIVRQVLWLNRYIKIDKKHIFNENMYNCGIVYINDLLNDRGKLYGN